MKIWFFICILLCIILENPCPSFSLEPGEVLVLVNTRDRHSLELAKYYTKKRNIPDENIVKVRLTEGEACSFKEYKDKVEEPVRKYIIKYKLKGKIRCILLMYGMPLKFTHPDKEETGIKTKSASLDSELALIFEEKYDLSGWQPNPFYVGYHNKYEAKRDYVLMVSRLDGPDPETVKRVIDDSIAAENTGLTGNAYFDARWPENTSEKELSGYELYDNSIYKAAVGFKKKPTDACNNKY